MPSVFFLECRTVNITKGVIVFYINYNSRFNLSSDFLSFTSLASGQPKLYSGILIRMNVSPSISSSQKMFDSYVRCSL